MREPLDVHGTPVSWPLAWPEGLEAGVFLGALRVDETALERVGLNPHRIELEVFGARRPLASPSASWRAEYLVLERATSDAPRAHHLAQHNHSIFYKAADDPCTSEAADMLKKDNMPCASRRPRWKLSEASWPVFEGNPSLFLGQLYVPETPTTKERFGWDEAVFVFGSLVAGVLRLQIYSEDMSAQTAEDHYRLEEMIADFEAHRHDPSVVRPLIESGDRYFYEFLFDHPKLDEATLALVAQHGKTKTVRNRATKELRRRSSAG